MGVRVADANESASSSHYFQQFIDGLVMSVLFRHIPREYSRWGGETAMMGLTEQLVGEPWLHAEPFAYCGNIGPVELPPEVWMALKRYGAAVSNEVDLRGLWGLDFVFDDVNAYPIEVNPRYTASAEVIELATRTSLLAVHAAGFGFTAAPTAEPRADPFVVGKAVYYAPDAVRFPDSGPWNSDLADPVGAWGFPDFADIPDAGSVIEPGQPVLTFFTSGHTAVEVRERLQSRAAELDSLFAEHAP